MQMNDYNDSLDHLNWVRRELGRWQVRESGANLRRLKNCWSSGTRGMNWENRRHEIESMELLVITYLGHDPGSEQLM